MRTLPRVLWGWLLMLSFSGGEELCPLSTDRPDTMESPQAVDAGHYQIEGKISLWERDGSARPLTLGQLNSKVVSKETAGLQLIPPFYQQEKWEALLNTARTWRLDGGVRLGLTDASADMAPYLGMSTRY